MGGHWNRERQTLDTRSTMSRACQGCGEADGCSEQHSSSAGLEQTSRGEGVQEAWCRCNAASQAGAAQRRLHLGGGLLQGGGHGGQLQGRGSLEAAAGSLHESFERGAATELRVEG
jgi:hypothetical protein